MVKAYEDRIKQLEVKARSLDESQKNSKSSFNVELQNLQNAIKEK